MVRQLFRFINNTDKLKLNLTNDVKTNSISKKDYFDKIFEKKIIIIVSKKSLQSFGTYKQKN